MKVFKEEREKVRPCHCSPRTQVSGRGYDKKRTVVSREMVDAYPFRYVADKRNYCLNYFSSVLAQMPLRERYLMTVETLIAAFTDLPVSKYGVPIRVMKHEHVAHDYIFKTQDLYGRSYFENFIRSYLLDATVVVDVGASVGTYTLWCLKEFKHLQVVAFEPHDELASLLEHNLNVWEVHDRCQVFRCVVGHSTGMVTLPYYWNDQTGLGNGIGAFVLTNGLGEGLQHVSMTTLDASRLKACDLIKIDVKGGEPFVLLGAIDTITRFRPVIILEMNGHVTPKILQSVGLSEDTRPSHASEILLRLNYAFYSIPGPGQTVIAIPLDRFGLQISRIGK